MTFLMLEWFYKLLTKFIAIRKYYELDLYMLFCAHSKMVTLRWFMYTKVFIAFGDDMTSSSFKMMFCKSAIMQWRLLHQNLRDLIEDLLSVSFICIKIQSLHQYWEKLFANLICESLYQINLYNRHIWWKKCEDRN